VDWIQLVVVVAGILGTILGVVIPLAPFAYFGDFKEHSR
jgi:hypothetical protein